MVKAIVGANWGDEGKGKITDLMAEHSDIVVRFQGGANAGHTIINDYGRFALHTLPSGVFYTPEELTAYLTRAGFVDIRQYGDRKLRPPRDGEERLFFTARKPAESWK